mgnify:CR=1 FL=1|jgi:nitroreductase
MIEDISACAVLACLHSRVSVSELQEPAPTPEQQQAIFQAALRAPDHGQLRPWRFHCVTGEARGKLGVVLLAVEEALQGTLTEAQRNKILARPLRAPLVLIVSAAVQSHPKIPELEQLLSTATAVEAMLLAAHAVGVGAIWRTGPSTYEPLLAEKLGLAANEKLLGFLYLGTPKGILKPVPALDVDDFFKPWPAA